MFAKNVAKKYCQGTTTTVSILQINSFTAYMQRNIAYLVMRNMVRIYYYCRRDDEERYLTKAYQGG